MSRYMRILEAIAAAPGAGLTLTEIAQRLDLKAPSVHRLTGSLKTLDLLACPEGSKSYVLGRRLQALLHSTLSFAEYSRLATTILRGLVDELGETVHLAKLNDNIAESVLMVQPEGSNRAFVQPGRQLPLHAAASGKAILAFQSAQFVQRFLTRPRTRYTDNTKTSAEDIQRELARVRETGLAVCDNELDAGVLSYGHPVRVKGGYVLYSIGVTGIADRFRAMSPETVRRKLARAAAQLSERLGYAD
jgi:IclR family acetate operon transcriptional repressor